MVGGSHRQGDRSMLRVATGTAAPLKYVSTVEKREGRLGVSLQGERVLTPPSPVWGIPTPKPGAVALLLLASSHPKEMSILGGRAGSQREKCQSRTLGQAPSAKVMLPRPLGIVRAAQTVEKGNKHFVSVQGSCLQKPWGGRGTAWVLLSPKAGFPEGFLWESVPLLALRPSRAVA